MSLPVPPPFCLGGEILQVLKSPLWPLLSTTSVYQNFETGDSLAETDRPTAYSVPGQHANYACQQGPTDLDVWGFEGMYPLDPFLSSNPLVVASLVEGVALLS